MGKGKNEEVHRQPDEYPVNGSDERRSYRCVAGLTKEFAPLVSDDPNHAPRESHREVEEHSDGGGAPPTGERRLSDRRIISLKYRSTSSPKNLRTHYDVESVESDTAVAARIARRLSSL